jgi:hypothetical protein
VNQGSLFIFNSNRMRFEKTMPMVFLAAWTFFGLAIIDLFINFVFAYPSDPKITNPSRLQQYFEYGRSAEGQLSRMTRQNRSETAPITLVGWYDSISPVEGPPKPNSFIVTFYGASHTVKLAQALGRVSNKFSPRSIGAPGATPNWSYGAYLRDRGGGKSRAVVLAFNSNNLAMISSLSPMIWSGDFPTAYTADRFYLQGDQLKAIHPPYTSFEQYVKTFYDPSAWSAALAFFAKNDPLYSPFRVRANILDDSALCRLFRRSYATQQNRDREKAVLDKSGFSPDSDEIRVALAIIHEFAKQARGDGMIPVIYLVNNLGYSDNLFRALQPILEADKIPYLSSHTIVSPNDPRNYLPDSHFTDENDDRLAAALVEVIENAR